MKRDIKSYAPDVDERRLLQAILDKDSSNAQASARTWLDSNDLENLNEGHRRLMPFLKYRITSWNMEHQKLEQLSRDYRRYWISSKRNHFETDRLVEALAKIEGPVILLKGAALGRTVYTASALRPFTDIDLLVHPRSFESAQRLLVSYGFRLEAVSPHSSLLVRHDSLELDLHRSPYHEAVSEDLVNPLLSRIIALPNGGNNMYRLGDEDQLLHTLAHGLRANVVSPVRWMVDAMLQLRATGEAFDWSLFCEEAVRLDLVEVAARALSLLNSLCPGEIDLRALGELERRRTAMTNIRFAAERQWHGPSVVWGMARRNQNWLGTLTLVLGHYNEIGAKFGYAHLARRALAWIGIVLTNLSNSISRLFK